MEIDQLLQEALSAVTLADLFPLASKCLSLRVTLAGELSSLIVLYSQTFLMEKSGGYQTTVAEAEHKAKELTGGRIESIKADLETLTMAYQLTMKRIDELGYIYH